MGLSIYYNGKLSSPDILSALIEEVQDVAEAHRWSYNIFEMEFPDKTFKNKFNEDAFGICFAPPKCEPVCLTFLSNGYLVAPWSLEYYLKNGKNDKQIISGVFTKTQYSGLKAHKIIIDLLRYLSKKYFKEFKLIDESRYWETNDEKIMNANFRRYTELMDNFGAALDNMEKRKGESVEKYLLRVMESMSTKKKDK